MKLKYRVYQRDMITGHMNEVADVDCSSDLEAAEVGRQYAEGEDIIMCQGNRIIHLCQHTANRAAA